MTGRLWQVPGRRGGVAPLVAISLVMLLSFVALAVDAGYIYVSRAQMQRAVDASALAGASALLDGDDAAIARALDAAGRNAVGGTPVSAEEAAVIIGSWNGTKRQFQPGFDSGGMAPNAVRVIGTRTDVPLFFGRVLGNGTTDVIKDAIALANGNTCVGVWGLQGVTGDGNIFTDSYDAIQGPYGPGNVSAYGDICSCQNIELSGDVDINGDAMWGEGYSLITSGSSYYIAGSLGEQRCQEFVPEIDMEGAAFNNDNATIRRTRLGRDPFGGTQWDLVVTGQDNLTLAGGTYYFTSVVIDGQATLTVTEATTIYISGPALFTGGGITNVTEDPANLLIYSTGATMNLTGTAGFHGAVIAPTADLVLEGTGDYYGTLLGRTLDMDGTSFIHVDRNLAISLFDLENGAPILVE